MATPDMDVIKEIPGYKVILKAVLKSQIQQLVEQLATTTDEESVILTASVGDGTLSHLGSDSGKTFLEDHEDIKSQFLGFCLKRHHKQKQEKMEKERQEALARVAPVTPPRYGGMGGPRASYMPQRSPRFTSPRNQGPHPVALSRASTGALRNTGQGGARHEPYPTQRAPRRGSLSFDQGPGPRPNVGSGGQVIKVEPTDDEQSNQSAPGITGSDTAQGSSEPSSPSVNQTGLQQSTEREDDAKSESSSSTIPNESSDLKQTDNVPPGGLSLGSDLSSLIPGVATTTSESVHDTSGMDPNVSVKLEAGDDGDMDLEITGVELGSRPGDPVMAGSQDWAQQAMGGMPTGASGGPGDMTAQQGYNSSSSKEEKLARHQYARPPAGVYDPEFASQNGMDELFSATGVYLHKDQMYTSLNKSVGTSPKGGRDGKRIARYLLTVFFTMEQLQQSSLTGSEASKYSSLDQQIVEAIIAFSVFNSDTRRGDILKAMRSSLTSKRCKAKIKKATITI